METKKFPEKWSIKGSQQLKEFIKNSNIKISNISGESRSGWYNFDGDSLDYSYEDDNRLEPLFELVTIQQLNDHYIKKRKIIGYNLKKEFELKEKFIADTLDTSVGKINGCWLPSGGTVFQTAENMKLLDLWFEPVYEKELQEIILEIGSPVKRVKITSKGKIVTDDEVQYICSINYVEEILKGFTNLFNAHISKIWIGCSEGTEVSKEEVEKVIETYKQLNP